MVFSKKKRGTINYEVYFLITQIFLASLTFIALMGYVIDSTNNSVVKELFLSRDIALLIDMASSRQGNLNYYYANDVIGLENYNFMFVDNLVKISSASNDHALVVNFPFALNYKFSHLSSSIPYSNGFNIGKSIGKSSTEVYSSKDEKNIHKISCNDIDSKNLDWKNSLVIIYSDFSIDSIVERVNMQDQLLLVANELKSILDVNGVSSSVITSDVCMSNGVFDEELLLKKLDEYVNAQAKDSVILIKLSFGKIN